MLPSRKRHLQSETREDVRAYHTKHRALTVPYDPYAVEAHPVQPVQPSLWRLLEEEGEELRKAREEEGPWQRSLRSKARGSARTGVRRGPGRLASARGRRP